jgi:hypothetical protein
MDTTPFFTGPELFVFVLFVGALIWLLVDIAFRDIHILRDMFSDSEKFAKPEPPAHEEPAVDEAEIRPIIERRSGPAREQALATVLAAEFNVKQHRERIRESKRAGARR